MGREGNEGAGGASETIGQWISHTTMQLPLLHCIRFPFLATFSLLAVTFPHQLRGSRRIPVTLLPSVTEQESCISESNGKTLFFAGCITFAEKQAKACNSSPSLFARSENHFLFSLSASHSLVEFESEYKRQIVAQGMAEKMDSKRSGDKRMQYQQQALCNKTHF